jgi:hypothetical protein
MIAVLLCSRPVGKVCTLLRLLLSCTSQQGTEDMQNPRSLEDTGKSSNALQKEPKYLYSWGTNNFQPTEHKHLHSLPYHGKTL